MTDRTILCFPFPSPLLAMPPYWLGWRASLLGDHIRVTFPKRGDCTDNGATPVGLCCRPSTSRIYIGSPPPPPTTSAVPGPDLAKTRMGFYDTWWWPSCGDATLCTIAYSRSSSQTFRSNLLPPSSGLKILSSGTCYLAYFQAWKWSRYVPPKRHWTFAAVHGITFQK
jgi:hypothetical protein